MTNKKEKLSMMERVGFLFLSTTQKRWEGASDEWYIFNETERRIIRQQERQLLILAALSGAFFVTIYYMAVSYFPAFFAPVSISIWGKTIPLPIYTNVYSIILTFIEIAFLTTLNLRAVHRIADVCGFPSRQDPEYERYIAALAEASIGKEENRFQQLGLDPSQDIPKLWVLMINFMNVIKATLSFYLVRLIIQTLLGRVVMRVLLDYAGIPVYAFWNCVAAHKVLREAKIRILAPRLIHEFEQKIHHLFQGDAVFKEHIYDVLQFMTMTSRRFHYTHYLFASQLLVHFEIPIQKKLVFKTDYRTFLDALPSHVRDGYIYVLIFGFMIDGRLGRRELRVLERLYAHQYSTISPNQVVAWEKKYRDGYGMPELMQLVEKMGEK